MTHPKEQKTQDKDMTMSTQQLNNAPAIDEAYEMGATGGPIVEAERLAFEAWMRGHCWALCAEWDGTSYRGSAENGNYLCPRAMNTRQLWAAWRDRAALAAPQPLTDDRINELWRMSKTNIGWNDFETVVKEVESAHGITGEHP